MSEEEVKAALRRRALGFETDEVVEEYGFNEGEAVLQNTVHLGGDNYRNAHLENRKVRAL